MGDLGKGSVVNANLSIGRHPAIVLSTKEEIEESGLAYVVAISSNATISLEEDRIEVPRLLGMTKKCYVQCGVAELIRISEISPRKTKRRAFGDFLDNVQKQVRIATARAKKSTLS